MALTLLRNLLKHNAQPTIPVDPDYPRLITDNLVYIERQCIKAVSHDEFRAWSDNEFIHETQLENDADELLNEVLDHLKAEDYRVLRDFKGASKITTYLTAIISNLVIDLVRKKKGRSRAKDRAVSMGVLGIQLYNLVYCNGYSLQDAHGHLVQSYGISEDIDVLRNMLEKIHGHNKGKVVSDWPYHGKEVLVDNEVEVVVANQDGDAEDKYIEREQKGVATKCVSEIINSLSGEDRFILTLRFPQDEEIQPKNNREIAALLGKGKTEKAVDARIRRILKESREVLLAKGLSLDDLIYVKKNE